ncbi:hypothetical protein D3C76_1824380 [compost metagenome]
MQAMTQVSAVDIKGQSPAFDVDLYRTWLFIEALERAKFQGGVAQLLVNLAGGQGRHGWLR